MRHSSLKTNLFLISIFTIHAIQSFSQQIGENFRIYPSGVSQTETFIITHPTNPDIMFASANSIIFNPFFVSEGIYVTTNGGNNWFGSDTCKGAPITLHGGDPGITINKDGTFILTRRGFSPGLYSHYSTDNGITWSNQKTITNDDLERAAMTSDVHPSSLYYGRSYAAWVKFAPPFPINFAFTDDGGVTWSSPAQINNPLQRNAGGDIAMGPNAKVFVCWAAVNPVSPFTEDFVGFAFTTNGGTNWQVTENAFDMNGINGILTQKANIRVNGLPNIAIDTTGGVRNGWIYIITTQKNLAPAGSDPDVILNRSTDGGQTWSAGIRVNQDPVNNGKIQYFPAVHVDKAGGLNVIFYDDRKTTSDSAGVFLARSNDGGNSWSEYEISSHNFKPIPIGGLGQGYQGDNISINSSNGILWPVWMDNSTGIYQIWTAPIDTSFQNNGLLFLNSPNGGENWQIGTTQNITWQSSRVDNIKIEYSTNNGTNWQLIVDNYPANSGVYSWLIPNTPSNACRVKISDVQNLATYDISSDPFSISGIITVTQPNGGEQWTVGSNKNITWTYQNVTNLKLDYSTNNGSSWMLIDGSVPASNNSYNWIIPNTVSSSCKVRISDLSNLSNYDISDNVFSIIPIPSITILYPNGGESFEGTTLIYLSYNSIAIDSVMIHYSLNAGASWVLVYSSIQTGSNIGWVIPNITSENCLIKLTDTEDNNIYDVSDNVFSITEVGWYPQGSNIEDNLYSIDMWNSDIGYSCGINGSILKTTNGGQLWESLSTGIVEDLHSLKFVTENTGWVVGNNGKILKTTNSGLSWSYQASNTTNALYSVYFINQNTGWTVGYNGTIRKTTDSGNSWFTQQSNVSASLNSVFFYSASIGWIVGNSGTYFKTTNGGNTWIQKTTGTTSNLNSTVFTSNVKGFIVGSNGTILLSEDAGEIWTNVSTSSGTYNSISFADAETGYIVGAQGTIYKSTDTGITWFSIGSGLQYGEELFDVTFTDINTGWAVGESGTIIKTVTGGAGYPVTNLIANAPASSQILEVTTIEGFSVGDNLIINPGGFNEEINKVVGFGSILLETPLQYDHYSGELVINLMPTSVEEEVISELPTEHALFYNYPNPFNPTTIIRYSVPKRSHVILKIYNMLGKEIEIIVNEEKEAGSYEITWFAEHLPSGIYFYRIQADSFVETKKMILLK